MALFYRRTFSTSRVLRSVMDASRMPEVFHPPVNKTMRELDRSFFRKTVPTSAITVFNPRDTSKIRGTIERSRELLRITGIQPIIDDEKRPGSKCIILQPDVKADQSETWSPQLTDLVESGLGNVRSFDLMLTYDNWTMQNILDAVLPDLPEDQKETPAGFTQAGHVAHVNLKNQYLPYKYLIGQVLMDKNPSVQTVINKTLDVGSESEFRTFPYEILAGSNNLDVTVSEQGCDFKFNFAEVYWNSRLGTEHERIVSKFQPGEAVCDAMAGVGPFAIPAGKKKVFVRANDLNPHCHASLLVNIENNKVADFVSASCSDGRHFIQDATAQLFKSPRVFKHIPNIKIPRNASLEKQMEIAQKRLQGTITYEEPKAFHHYVMNLPASAVEFLDAFAGLYKGREAEFVPHSERKLPMVHVYTFQAKKDTDTEEVKDVCEKVSKYLGAEIRSTDKDVEVLDVRLVSPKKKFYRVSFRLPQEVAFASS